MEQLKVTDKDGRQTTVSVDMYPDTCPLCHRGMEPKFIDAYSIPGMFDDSVDAIFRCVIRKCQRVFIAEYRASPHYQHLELYSLAPRTPRKALIPDEVATNSPSFVEIYNQALHAEGIRLHEIAGVGYRKALEYLVKDFIISTKPDDDKFVATVKAKMLGPCISEFIDDPKIKLAATRATWLGNDETHYVRKWENQDINDLKKLITVTVSWIQTYILTRQYEKEMPKGK